MRGRGLIKESSCPNLCAFCAHRLGQARGPSQFQRRFLQNSRSLSKPPSEASGTREGDDEKQLPSAVGQNSQIGPGNWGGIGGKSVGAFGSWTQSAPISNSVSSESVKEAELLPHEKRARELLLLQQQKTNETPLRYQASQSSRGGRPQVSGWHQREDRVRLAQEARARYLARENDNAARLQLNQSSSGTSGPRIRRLGHVVGQRNGHGSSREDSAPTSPAGRWGDDSRATNPTTSTSSGVQGNDFSDSGLTTSAWSSLRRRSELSSGEQAFTQARSDREEQAKTATYSPLWKGSSGNERYKRDSAFDREDYGFDGGSGRRESSSYVERSQHRLNRRSSPSNFNQPLTQNQIRIRQQRQQQEDKGTNEDLTLSYSDSGVYEAAAPKDYAVPKREKKKKGRSTYEPEPVGRGKGKDREKARRRQHFMSPEEAEEEEAEGLARAELKRLKKAERAAQKAAAPTPILLPEYISVSNLAVALKVNYEDFTEKLHDLGYEDTGRDHILNAENAGLIAGEYNFEAIVDRSESEDLKAREPAPDPSVLPPRPPVVTIMGHVDHGKTTLLDYLRKSSVAAGEHGGITQHIGAFSVLMPGGKTITFLDTPGHAAFLSMRQRGANVTDIVILVVAADDSVKPQTIEAINHAKAAKVPMIVAINKIDKGDSNIERVKQDLGRHGVEIEDFGGDTQVVLVSGKTGQGMSELEEAAITLSEILDMRAETDGPAEGWVLEASIKSMGKVATVLVRRGTMRVGDFIVAGNTWARIRCLRNEAGVEIEEAGPGTPVEIDGWREQPLAGDEVLQAPDESKAKSVVDYRLEKVERDKMAEDMEAVNQNRKMEQEKREREKSEAAAKMAAEEAGSGASNSANANDVQGPKQIYFIVKADVSGSVEAVVDSLSVLGNKEVQPNIIRSGVGQLSEFDIEHAAAAKGYLINFNTTVEPHIAQQAEKAKVDVLDHNIIYRLVDDVKAKLSEYLPPLVTQRVTGEAEIAQVFEITIKGRKKKNIAGCKVKNGTITKTERVRVLRNGEKVFDGHLESLKHVKKEVSEMKKGTECGMGFLEWYDFQVGDQIQTYQQHEEKRYL